MERSGSGQKRLTHDIVDWELIPVIGLVVTGLGLVRGQREVRACYYSGF